MKSYLKRLLLGMSIILMGGSLGWSDVASGPTLVGPRVSHFITLHFATRTHGWALTSKGIAQSTNGGHTWRWVTQWSRPLSKIGVPLMASWHHTIWVPVHHQILRESTSASAPHWIPSPVRALTIITMEWTSIRNGWILAAPQGISAESEAVQVWTTHNGGNPWHRSDPPPFVGVKTGLSLGGVPQQLWLGSTHVFHGSPLLWHATNSPGAAWQSSVLPIPAAWHSQGRQTLGAPLWLSPLRGVLFVEFWASPGASHGPIVVYRTQNGGRRWVWQGILDRHMWLGTPEVAAVNRDGGWIGIDQGSTTRIVHWEDGRSHVFWNTVSTLPGSVQMLDADHSRSWALTTTSVGAELWSSQNDGNRWERI